MNQPQVVDPTLMHQPTLPSPWQIGMGMLLPPTALAFLSVLGAQLSYLLFHALAELFSIVIALTALVVASTSRHFTKNHFVVFIAVAIGWCSAIDLVHTLVFKGMHLLPSDSANPPTQLWIAARFLEGAALLCAPLFLRRRLHVALLQGGFALITLLALGAIATGNFPAAYIDGEGLTPFKIYTEYLIILMLGGSLFLIWRNREQLSPLLSVSLMAALATMMLSEFAFTRYVSVYATSNMTGHILKIYAYWFVYIALVQSTLREPFSMLARAASTYDAVPDPTLVVQADGTILQANQAAARHVGVPVARLVGQDSHTLFHDTSRPPGQCPVCTRIASGNQDFSLETRDHQGLRYLEFSVAPFSGQNGRSTCVEVVRDITERRQLQTERETLVYNLGERIKELRCLYAISALIEQPHEHISALLAKVVPLLPPAFRFPDHTYAYLSSDWGNFGPPLSLQHQRRLERPLRINGQRVGTLCVSYPDSLETDQPVFLPEEQALMDTVALRLSETIERHQATLQIQRLSYLYEMLSATNRAIVRCHNIDELLSALFESLITHGTFPMLFLALSNNGDGQLHIVRTHGIAAEYLPELESTLNAPGNLLSQSREALLAGNVVWATIPHESRPQSWHVQLHAAGIQERAFMPLRRNGQIFGIVGLYAHGLNTFNEGELRLLNEMASDMAFALDTLMSDARRVQAEALAQLSESRFQDVFESSPLPMQIQSISRHSLRALNRAHEAWLGYGPEEIATEDDWFDKVYADPQVREAGRQQWPDKVEQARQTRQPVGSGELTLRCKDGSLRIAQGTMTVIGDDAVIAWNDLTESRRNQRALEESEQRFRGMIEQTLTGIYVRREHEFVYVNPRFCELVGWDKEELLGQDPQRLLNITPENWVRSDDAWKRLTGGERSVSYSVPLQRKDGTRIELGLHATGITWDNAPAMIVMAQDITERKRAEAQIASYVQQLEKSMQGTLRAVSNMVDLRDPYTAGHERRVGLIAAAIAQELGWPEERCRLLEMVGLVHDIGKIAVPAEILSKPRRLTELEMALVRGHALAGYDILKDVQFSAPVAEIIYQHHERLDGSGYPRGLKGEAILIEARLLAVADVLESMSAHRPYRPALGLDAALAELHQGRHTLFDADVVDAVHRLLREKGYQLPP